MKEKPVYIIERRPETIMMYEVWMGDDLYWKGSEEEYHRLGGVGNLPYQHRERPFIKFEDKNNIQLCQQNNKTK